MKYIQISVDGDKQYFLPGENIGGTARWQLEESVESLEIRLFYYTEGKGTTDIEVVETTEIKEPPMSGSQRFEWRLPNSPYSFSGKLISLLWAVEVVLLPAEESEVFPFQMTPTGKEIFLRGTS